MGFHLEHKKQKQNETLMSIRGFFSQNKDDRADLEGPVRMTVRVAGSSMGFVKEILMEEVSPIAVDTHKGSSHFGLKPCPFNKTHHSCN